MNYLGVINEIKLIFSQKKEEKLAEAVVHAQELAGTNGEMLFIIGCFLVSLKKFYPSKYLFVKQQSESLISYCLELGLIPKPSKQILQTLLDG